MESNPKPDAAASEREPNEVEKLRCWLDVDRASVTAPELNLDVVLRTAIKAAVSEGISETTRFLDRYHFPKNPSKWPCAMSRIVAEVVKVDAIVDRLLGTEAR